MNLELVTPPIDTQGTCRICGGNAIWDEVHGWMHRAAARPHPVASHQPHVDWTRSTNPAPAADRRA